MKTAVTGAIIVALLIAGVIGHSCYRNHAINKGFSQVKIGATESQVVLLMGKPDKVVLPGHKDFWSSPTEGTVKEYHYHATILPEIWVIGLNSKGEVAYRNHNVM